MKESELTRPEAVLAGLLYALAGSVYRTKLVKLVYLLDEANYRLRGQTMTGFEYVWDNYGPNAESNGIVHQLDGMVEAGMVVMRSTEGPQGPRYIYKISPHCDLANLQLTSDNWVEIYTAVSKYGKLNTRQIVSFSKATAPMRKAKQYNALELTQDTPADTRRSRRRSLLAGNFGGNSQQI